MAISEESKLSRFLRKTNIKPEVAVSKRVEGSFKMKARAGAPRSESHFANEPNVQKI
jgi:hypothetical protein